MIEPQLFDPRVADPSTQTTKDSGGTPIRLLYTQARGHIGRRLLHQLPNGELTEDPIWRWSSFPSQYLDTALRREVASNPNLRLVDSASATEVAATLLTLNLDSQNETRLVVAVEFQVTGTDRAIQSRVVQASEPVTGELPGDLAAVAGRLLRRMASEGLRNIASER
jgi:hypothetical protein